MKKALVSLAIALGIVAGVALPASAHMAKTINGSVDCAGKYSIAGTADVWGGHFVQVNILGVEVARLQDNGQDTSVKPWGPVTGTTTAKPGDAISARTLNPNGSVEQGEAVTGVLTDGGGDCTPPTCKELNNCPKPPPHHRKHRIVRRPKVGIIGPCGDPFYAAIFDNLHSNRAVYFRWAYTSYATGRTVIVGRWVRAHRLVTTQFRHVLGYSTQYVWARRAFLKVRTAAPGNYGVCKA